MDKRIHMLLEDAENDLSKKEVLGILMHIIAGTYQLLDQSFYLCIPVEYRDIRIRQEDEKEILNRLISIINKKGDNMEYAMKCISDMQNNKAYKCAEELFLQEDWGKYPDFLGTLIFFLAISDRKFKKYIPKTIEYYNTIDNVFFHETVGALLEAFWARGAYGQRIRAKIKDFIVMPILRFISKVIEVSMSKEEAYKYRNCQLNSVTIQIQQGRKSIQLSSVRLALNKKGVTKGQVLEALTEQVTILSISDEYGKMATSKEFQAAVMEMSKNIQTKNTIYVGDQPHMSVSFTYNKQEYRIVILSIGKNLKD